MNIRTIDIRTIILYAMGALTVFTFITISGDDWAKPREEARTACKAARKEGRIYRVSNPKSGGLKENFYGRKCVPSFKWKYFELWEVKDGDYKTYEELRKAEDPSSVRTTSTGAS